MIKIRREFDLKEIAYSRLAMVVDAYVESDDIRVLQGLLKSGIRPFYVGKMSKLYPTRDRLNLFVFRFTGTSIERRGNLLIVDSGVSLKELGNYAVKNGIAGFEKVMTVPGELGGSLKNNAGFLDQTIADPLLFLLIVDEKGERRLLTREELDIGYRHLETPFPNAFLFQAVFRIRRETRFSLYQKRREAYAYRRKHQPPILSLGSTFKNREGIKAYLVVKACVDFETFLGLKIDPKHGNFIEIRPELPKINLVKLIERIEELVYNKFGFCLETEIRMMY